MGLTTLLTETPEMLGAYAPVSDGYRAVEQSNIGFAPPSRQLWPVLMYQLAEILTTMFSTAAQVQPELEAEEVDPDVEGEDS